ncbi:MAG: HD domain-containing protein [Phycisphaerales bacterium]|nr:HD domain-containing protein [Phycisphaerales bacterium]
MVDSSKPVSDTTNRPLASLVASMTVDGIYTISNPQVGVARNGKHYLKGFIRDASGEAVIRKWTFAESALAEVSATGYVWVSGRVESYQNALQVVLDDVRAVEVDVADLARLVPCTKHNIEEMWLRVQELMRSLHHPAMRALAEAYLTDAVLMGAFCRAPAAVSIHHAFIGGLLEHTLQLLELAERMLPRYPALNRDLVLTGLFLHDLGKTSELEWEHGFSYSVDGQLIGHIVRGAIMLQVKAAVATKATGEKLPGETLRVLQHIILSHHYQLEHGAAKVPATPEAVFVAMLDNLDAKTFVAIEMAGREKLKPESALFSDRSFALETRVFRPDPLA